MAVKTKVASDLFRQRWFRELAPEYKTLWLYLMIESNIVGVFEIDEESWNYFCRSGSKIKSEDAFTRFGNRIQRVPKHAEKGLVVGKLDFQNAFGENSSQWKWVEKELDAIGISYAQLKQMKSREEEQLELDFGSPSSEKQEAKKPKDEKFQIPPTVEMVKAYCSMRNNGVDATQFVDYYESNGWMVGSNRMKNWQSAVGTWERRNAKRAKSSPIQKVQNQPIRTKF